MTKETVIGLVCLILGTCFLWWTIKHPIKDDYLTGNVKGIIGGVGAIIIGILLLIGYLKWQ